MKISDFQVSGAGGHPVSRPLLSAAYQILGKRWKPFGKPIETKLFILTSRSEYNIQK